MADILCPHCGMPNTGEQKACSFCQKPLSAASQPESIRPGQAPTKKSTADLEPVLPEWLRDAREKARTADAEKVAEEARAAAAQPAPQKEEPPDFLAGLASAANEEPEDEIPDWMRSAPPPSAPSIEKDKTFPRRQELRWDDEPEDQLGGMVSTPEPHRPENGDTLLPWMAAPETPFAEEGKNAAWIEEKPSALPEPEPISPFASGSFQPPDTGELTNWLDKAATELPAQPASDDSLGQWLSSLPGDEAPSAPSESNEPIGGAVDLPDWLKRAESTAAPQETQTDFELPGWMGREEPPAAPQETKSESELPSWMASFGESNPAEAAPAFETPPQPEIPRAPAFLPGEETAPTGQAEELFSIEMPDWLSNITPVESKPVESNEPSPEAIAPAELPTWVQAMRPLETALPDSQTAAPIAEGPLEDRGPLAGLRGVLPLAAIIQPGKPKPQAIRLQADESQQASASLLEQMLAAETQAEPLHGVQRLAAQRVLRWVISILLILLVTVSLAGGLKSVPLPSALPAESAPILPLLDLLPDGAPALMIFDYEPALAGELEAAAEPLLDRLLALRRPRITVLSTSPTGPALAERFFRDALGRHNYQGSPDYVNLGYLPGGSAGILSFAENPRAAISLPEKWAEAAAQDVTRFGDYAAFILLTDQSETARAWIEQTTAQRAGRPLIVVSSAQAAPMIQPYVLSGQAAGLVSGLRGGAAFASGEAETKARGYWDAYNFAALFAAAAIVLGALWNFIAGARARRRGGEEV